MLLTLGVMCVAAAQPEASAMEAARRMGAFYESAPFAERAEIVIADANGNETAFVAVLRRGVFEGEIHTALELPGLRLHHAGRVLTAERAAGANPAVVFRIESSESFAEAIAAHVPAMPMPQLWRFDELGRCTDAAMGTVEIAGFDAAGRVLSARTSSGAMTLQLGADDRIVAMDAALGTGRMRAAYEGVEAGDPGSWAIPTAGRWVVKRLAQLTPPRSPIVAGEQLIDLSLMTPDYRGVKLSEFQAAGGARQAGPWVVLLVCRADAEEGVLALAGGVASSLWQRAAEEVAALDPDDVARYWLGHRAVVVAVSGELEILPGQMAELAGRAPQGVPLLVSSEPARTVDRLAAPAPLTAILIDPARTVGAVVPIENAETGVSAVMDAMRSFVRRRDEPAPTESGG